MLNSINYLVYLSLSIFATIFVARTLSKNGLAFLIEGFKGNEALAVSTNHLLVVGFYLLNIGFVMRRMVTNTSVDSFEQMASTRPAAWAWSCSFWRWRTSSTCM